MVDKEQLTIQLNPLESLSLMKYAYNIYTEKDLEKLTLSKMLQLKTLEKKASLYLKRESLKKPYLKKLDSLLSQ